MCTCILLCLLIVIIVNIHILLLKANVGDSGLPVFLTEHRE